MWWITECLFVLVLVPSRHPQTGVLPPHLFAQMSVPSSGSGAFWGPPTK